MKKIKEYNLKFDQNSLIQISGNAYQRGYQTGLLLKSAIRKETKNFDKIIKNDEETKAYLNKITNIIKADFAEAYDEVRGRAAGAGISYETYLYYMCSEFREMREKNLIKPISKEHCTSLMFASAEAGILAHNEDDAYTNKNIKIVKYETETKEKYIDFANSNSLLGTTVFVGQKFVITMNFIWFNQFNLDYIPMHFVVYKLMQSKSIEELESNLKTINCASALGLNICDKNSGNLYYAEKVLNQYSLMKISGGTLHANHLVHEKFLKFRPAALEVLKNSNTFNRYMVADLLLKDKLQKFQSFSEADALEILTFYNTCDYNSVMSKMRYGYDSLTFGTFIYNAKTQNCKVHIHNKQHTVMDLSLN